MTYGNINYDVPNTKRSHYAKLRSLFRRKAIMQTYSCYLFPWGNYDEIKAGLDRINSDEDGFPLPQSLQVRYSVFKYDEKVSGKALQQSAEAALRRQMASMKQKLGEKIMGMFAEDEDSKDPVSSAKVAARKASATLRDARALALMFNLTDNLEAGFLAYEAYIERRKEEIEDFETAAKVTDEIEEAEGLVVSLDEAKVEPPAVPAAVDFGINLE